MTIRRILAAVAVGSGAGLVIAGAVLLICRCM